MSSWTRARDGQVQTSPWLKAKSVKPFLGLVVERVVGVGDVVEEDVRALAAELQGDRDQVLAGVLADQAAGGGFAGEGDLADPGAGGQRLAGLDAEAVDHVEDAGRQQVADEFHQHQDRGRRLLGRLEDDGVAGGERRGELPDGHQDREVPGDDLADDAERLVVVVGGGVVVELGQPAFLGADGGGEVAEVVGGERDVGVEGFADRLAVVPGFGDGEHLEVLVDPVGDLVQDRGALGDGGLAPGRCDLVGGVQRQLDVLGGAAGDLAEGLAGDGGDVLEVLALDRGNPLAADPVLVAVLEGDLRALGTGLCVNSHC